MELRNEQLRVRIDAPCLRAQAESLLAAVGRAGLTLSILITDDRRIAPLHERWMGEPGPTDVMSFPNEMGTLLETSPFPPVLGDIVISAETAARRRPNDPHGEVLRYLVHGLLHLIGQDHQTERERLRMNRQARLLEKSVRK